MRAWPFTGRETVVEHIGSAIRRGRHVVIAGPAGVGKSRLAAEFLRSSHTRGLPITTVKATNAASAIPFGAIAHLLRSGSAPDGGNPLRWAADSIVAAGSAQPVLIGVDDAHLLDSGSAAVLHLLAHTGRARLLVTVRSGQSAPDTVAALWKDDAGTRIDLEPFDLPHVARILTEALDGPVAENTAQRLWQASGGNVMFLRELVLSALGQGTLSRAGAYWHLTGALPVSERLADLLDERIGVLDERTREVLEFTTLGEPIGLELLQRLAGPSAVEAAEARGLIVVGPDGRRDVVRLAHPLYGEVTRARATVLGTRRRLTALADGIESVGARRREDALRIAVWRLETGAAKPEVLTTGCRFAWAAHDYPLARRLGRAAVAAGGGVGSAILLAQVLNESDRFAEAEQVLDGVWDDAYDDDTMTKLLLARAHTLCWGLGRADDALELLSRYPSNNQEIAVMRMRIVGTSQGRWAEAAAIGESILNAPASPLLANSARTEQSWLMLYLGRPLDAIALAERVLADRELWRDTHPQLSGDMLTVITQASQSLGDMDAFDAVVARAAREVGQSEVFANTVMVNRGIAAMLRGQIATAVRLFKEAESYRPHGSRAMSGMSELARALAYLGDVAGATEALGEGAQRLFLFRRQKIPLGVRLAAPWIQAAAGNVTGALEMCIEAVEFFQQEGAVRRELIALHDAVRLGGAKRVRDRLAQLAKSYQGELAPLLAAHADAVATTDGVALERVGARFERMGRLLHAAEAFAQAAQVYQAAGRSASARACAGRARLLAARCETAITPPLFTLTAPELTPRELEIARLVATGLTSAQVAERLVLSVRTIDNHLGAVYAKLGVSGRAELRKALGGSA
ncbi:LuxR C-terminal-related transcriptional regulator [Allorhizocola rhizosphaerae]|uniref:LuxR C-terminal-related transcriptional regulator n=1 Tax=Allorhizocola rhizosphaerae TaxID=1872709 RepID=UPI000E3E11D2|nr:LuxR family transcriptional regulator [Allorhizocola rhizosphaerae]